MRRCCSVCWFRSPYNVMNAAVFVVGSSARLLFSQMTIRISHFAGFSGAVFFVGSAAVAA